MQSSFLREMKCQRDWCYSSNLFSIKTGKVVEIQNVWYGTLKWVICVVIIIYICMGLWSEKLYQRKDPLISSVHIKIKGIAKVTVENKTSVWDTTDCTFPLQGNSFFVITNFQITENQTQGICPQYPSNWTCCSTDDDCKQGRIEFLNKGVQTGKCVNYNLTSDQTHNLREICKHQKTCEVTAWCPIELKREAPQPALLASAENFTVLIKNSIHIPAHHYSTRNILPETNISCMFHKTLNPDCPIFRLGDILQEIGENFSSVAIHGGIVGIEIYWDCNLDPWFYSCSPKYSFRRLDDKTTNKKSSQPQSSWLSSVLSGSFRYAKYYKEGNVEKRTLIKAFGIRFDIQVFGTGGKFDIIQLIVYIGSTISYFGLATVLIDFLIQMYTTKCCRSWFYSCCKICEPCSVNEYYYEKKYETIVQPRSTLKYISFVDEPFIRMVNEDSLSESLQSMEGEKIPRPQEDSIDLNKLSLHPDFSPSPTPSEERQLLQEEPSSPSPEKPEWCHCGHCQPSQLPGSNKFLEELCCRRKEGPCITTSAPFEKLILSRSTLHFILLYEEPFLEMDADALNNQLRHCAYRHYINWRFGSKDMASSAILPSCCRWKVRKHFPKNDGKYTGFRRSERHKSLSRNRTFSHFSFKDSPI
ncbi:P2X purinoceptor 7-like [Macrotis lagotis]|uniref:P2X purinoceptor 7-like n=1 Tax=Macrotis lagotis TaxID=92651 RepID=UPI003D698F61